MRAHTTQREGLTKGALWKETFKKKRKKKKRVLLKVSSTFTTTTKTLVQHVSGNLLFFFPSFVLENRSWHWREHGAGGCGALKDGLTVETVNAAVCRERLPQRLRGAAHNIHSTGDVQKMLRLRFVAVDVAF